MGSGIDSLTLGMKGRAAVRARLWAPAPRGSLQRIINRRRGDLPVAQHGNEHAFERAQLTAPLFAVPDIVIEHQSLKNGPAKVGAERNDVLLAAKLGMQVLDLFAPNPIESLGLGEKDLLEVRIGSGRDGEFQIRRVFAGLQALPVQFGAYQIADSLPLAELLHLVGVDLHPLVEAVID